MQPELRSRAGRTETLTPPGPQPGARTLNTSFASLGRLGTVRRPLLLIALVSLLLGMWAGLLRLGWDLWPRPASLPAAHGPLMVVGFF